MTAPASMRGHHLLCLHFFAGEGYSPEYVENLRRVLDTAESEGVVVVEGLDDACMRCPGKEGTLCERQDEVLRLDGLALTLLDAKPGDRLGWEGLRSRLPDVLEAWYAGACDGCSWLEVCTHAGICDLCESAAGDAETDLP